MARTWTNSLATAPAFVAHDARHFDSYATPVTDTYTAPSSSPYTMVLDYRPKRGTLGVTIAGVAASVIEYGVTPVTGQVAVNYLDGRIVTAAADAGDTVVATYQHWGSVLDAGLWNSLQAAVADARVVLTGYWFGEVSTSGEQYLTAPGTGSDTWTIARVSVSGADASNATGQSVLAAHNARGAGAATATLTQAGTYTAGGGGTLTNTVAGASPVVVWWSGASGHQNVIYQVELVRA